MRPNRGKSGWLAAGCVTVILLTVAVVLGCGPDEGAGEPDGGPRGGGNALSVLADTTFLADIAQNVAGDRMDVSAILPVGTDPHSFEPTPQDARLVAESDAVIINVAGLVPQLDDVIAAIDGDGPVVIEAAGELVGARDDPHVWLDPVRVVSYVARINEGLVALDPEGAEVYRVNADAYSGALRELDGWIAQQVETIPAERRLLVTNHESLGYFAERYGFQIVGTVFPTVAGEGAPSARQLATLVDDIKATGAPAIFLETGSNADLADQVGRETGAEVVTELYAGSLGDHAGTYIDMMRWNVTLIVEALR